MDNNDEESQNSSENSFNEMVNVAIGAGFAFVHMLHVPPQGNHVMQVPELTGRQWVDKLFSDDGCCFENCRMRPESLVRLHSILTDSYGLTGSRELESIEALAMFLWACGTNQCQRQMHERFGRGLGTCSKIFSHVLAAMTRFANDVIRPRDTSYLGLPAELVEYTPFFEGCIGAMDGTHIDVIVDQGVRDNHINRKGKTTQNVVAVCDFDMRFTYVGAGTEGSTHDMRVKRKAEADASFPHPPSGKLELSLFGCVMLQLIGW